MATEATLKSYHCTSSSLRDLGRAEWLVIEEGQWLSLGPENRQQVDFVDISERCIVGGTSSPTADADTESIPVSSEPGSVADVKAAGVGYGVQLTAYIPLAISSGRMPVDTSDPGLAVTTPLPASQLRCTAPVASCIGFASFGLR
ncbi:hypothetical protein PISMIDRAFT_15656 [Pisolithus microcarpus 441]|uniref:Uncharacterized protein n=1 Tax=Pisolithus microcarpus 441 TaxID=765257 RepID=A0A0C9YRX7_9AGAM|nr:hypothetical protein PISMIDRAFT_15656 [Pisolithus microcarpus 441]